LGPKQRGFTLIELLVVIAVVMLLLSLLVPSLKAAKEQARVVACRSNLRVLGHCTWLYQQDYNYYVIPGAINSNWSVSGAPDDWYHLLLHPDFRYLPGCKWGKWSFPKPINNPFQCPSDQWAVDNANIGPWGVGICYFHNSIPSGPWGYIRYDRLKQPAETILLGEKDAQKNVGDSARMWSFSPGTYFATNRHFNPSRTLQQMNVLMMDGMVRSYDSYTVSKDATLWDNK
jgi:prepilin-type N-terminal cleavage/methylation domain-containing protein